MLIYSIKIPEELRFIFSLRETDPIVFDNIINNIIRIINLKILNIDHDIIEAEETKNLYNLFTLKNEIISSKETIVKSYIKLNEFFSYYIYLDNLENYKVLEYINDKIILKGD